MNYRRFPLVTRAMITAAVVEIGFRVSPQKSFKFWLKSTEPRQNAKRVDVEPVINSVVAAVRSATRYVPGAENCLVQAMTTKQMLADLGLKTDLRLGVAKVRSPFVSHAWLEYDGKPIIGGECIDQFSNSFPAL